MYNSDSPLVFSEIKPMAITWNHEQPIYRQLRERIVGLILTGVFKEGDSLPSVRQVAGDYQINHLTVSKAYQELVDMHLVEARRGMGMYVMPGAQKKLHTLEKDKFLSSELPALLTRIEHLGLSVDELCSAIKNISSSKNIDANSNREKEQ